MTIQDKLRLILIWNACVIVGVVALLVMFCAICTGSGRAKRIAVGFDQTGNAAFGGDEDETISARCWRLHIESAKYAALVKVINFLAGDPNHCRDAFIDELERRSHERMQVRT